MNVLRATVAGFVVLTHVRSVMFADYSTVPHNSLIASLYLLGSLGHPAVMVFFVLSGLWVGTGVRQRISHGNFSWRSFMITRLSRLWIVLLPVLGLVAIVDRAGRAWFPGSTVYTAGPGVYPGGIVGDLSQHLSMLTLLGNVGFLQDIRVSTYGTDSPLWSLAYEFWFYLLFPLALLALSRTATPLLRLAYACAGVGVVLLLGSTYAFVYFAVWLLGVVVGAVPTVPDFRLRGASTALAVFLTAVAMATAIHASRLADMAVGVAAACLIWLLRRDFSISNRIWRAAANYGQSSSYSLYLVHLPILALIAAAFVPDAGRRLVVGPATVFGAVGTVAALVVAGWLLSLVTERRTSTVRSWLFSRLTNDRSKTTSSPLAIRLSSGKHSANADLFRSRSVLPPECPVSNGGLLNAAGDRESTSPARGRTIDGDDSGD